MERRRFFDIMGTAPTAVTVVTTRDRAGRPRGLTVAAVTSVSAEPPSLLVCVDRRSRTLPDLVAAGGYAVNFLRGDRPDVASRFASALPDRFAGVEWRPGSTGAPILYADALAWAECRTQQVIESGDHFVLVAAVVDGSPSAPLSRPLMYFRHGFEAWPGKVAAPAVGAPASQAPSVADGDELPEHPGRVGDHAVQPRAARSYAFGVRTSLVDQA